MARESGAVGWVQPLRNFWRFKGSIDFFQNYFLFHDCDEIGVPQVIFLWERALSLLFPVPAGQKTTC